MALKSQRQLLGRDSGAVIDDPDQVPAGAANLDRDAPGARVEGVLDQLLDDRRRPLDHLPGGDRVGDLGGEGADRHDRRDFSS